MIKKELLKAKKGKRFVSIWMYTDQESFWCGRVIGLEAGILSLEHYTKYGLKDGLVYLNIADIESVDMDDRYSWAIGQLEKNTTVLHKAPKIKDFKVGGKNWRFKILDFALKQKKMPVSIDFESNLRICGVLKSMDASFICIDTYGKLGERKGKSIYRITEIEAVHLNDLETRKRLLLASLFES